MHTRRLALRDGQRRAWGGKDARVVESALEPLHRRGHERVLVNDHQVPRKRAHPLASHRVALVRHRRASNLVLLERLLDLLQVREQTDVGADLVCGRGERGERGEDVDVDLAGVGLARYGVGLLESRKFGHERVELLDLVPVSLLPLSYEGRTLSWSPSNSARKDPCVPVVPLTPRNPMSSRARWMFRRSQSSSCSAVSLECTRAGQSHAPGSKGYIASPRW